jgi:hypothetical protein
MSRGRAAALPLLILLAFASADPAEARSLEVGASRALKLPSAAAAIAVDGDTVAIDPGEYFDCAIWRARGLTIAATGPGVVVTDKTCEGKALFVVAGEDTTIKDMTFTRARVADLNGAGIRVEGKNLSIERCRFVNNEEGILAADAPASTIRILDSEFLDNGTGAKDRPQHALAVGRVALLRVERSIFAGTRGVSDVASSARRTELIGNRLDSSGARHSLYAVVAMDGGSLTMEDDILRLGPGDGEHRAAILVSADHDQSAGDLVFRRNVFDHAGGGVPFLLNWTGRDPVLKGNRIAEGDPAVSSAGSWWHWTGVTYHATKDDVLHLAGVIKRGLSPW